MIYKEKFHITFSFSFHSVNLKNSLIATEFLNCFCCPSIYSGFWTMKTFSTILALLASRVIASSIAEPVSELKERNLEACPSGGNLPAGALYPSLSVLVSQKLPNVPFSSTQTPLHTANDFCTITNFLLPISSSGKICTLEFLFPTHLSTLSPYIYTGGGHFNFTGYALNAGATTKTTFNTQPALGPNSANPPSVLSPGNSYVINSAECPPAFLYPAGKSELLVSGMLCTTDTYLSYLISKSLGCPIGLFVTIT
ncbi:gpi anchored cell wall protein [Rutstroemia sp. NJR-2017a BVV2]|nr:gpi anchored cell wall protein [Rutstroemia sp. NJR-2017a BVV2]